MAIHSISFPASQESRSAAASSSRDVLIFMISGNPGLIDYYEPFLSALRTLPALGARFHIYGQDLAGFNDDDHEPFSAANPPRDVAYQVDYLFKTLSEFSIPEDDADSSPKQGGGKPFDQVILVGHSVGAYLILQLFHKLLRDPAAAPHLRLQTGFLLFPTIEHIRHSPSGQRLELLRSAAFLERHAHLLASGFLRLWPYAALRWVVATLLGQPPAAADVTARWLKSRDGVWQALHMGLDEMRVIGEDQWDEELWEIEREEEAEEAAQARQRTDADDDSSTANGRPPKFIFFFGKDDHWVANHFRDAFIERRQKQAERTRFMVDEGNLPHAFCIHHSEVVAEKVASWVNELYVP
ncbi:hypothetical protein PG994_003087 [Apiospora phragmitis]|uniref:Lipid droplet-associated hydrolase n=1 Tax=Apiospora phragmitis TaxID=2905665 RepID=A0ABR1W9Y5_9PEZI